uniref:Uncharacterized protein n=1 Tax=Setaria digitata TaxID=48799 RepID=A0A915Q0P2_9BILA
MQFGQEIPVEYWEELETRSNNISNSSSGSSSRGNNRVEGRGRGGGGEGLVSFVDRIARWIVFVSSTSLSLSSDRMRTVPALGGIFCRPVIAIGSIPLTDFQHLFCF